MVTQAVCDWIAWMLMTDSFVSQVLTMKQVCWTSAFLYPLFYLLLCWQEISDNSNSLLFHCVFNSFFIFQELNKAVLPHCQELKQTRCAGPDGEVQFGPILIESIISVQLRHDRMPLYLSITLRALSTRDTAWCISADGLRLRLEDRKSWGKCLFGLTTLFEIVKTLLFSRAFVCFFLKFFFEDPDLDRLCKYRLRWGFLQT